MTMIPLDAVSAVAALEMLERNGKGEDSDGEMERFWEKMVSTDTFTGKIVNLRRDGCFTPERRWLGEIVERPGCRYPGVDGAAPGAGKRTARRWADPSGVPAGT